MDMETKCALCGRVLGATANLIGGTYKTPEGMAHLRCPTDEPEEVGTAIVATIFGWTDMLTSPRPWVRIYGESPNRWVSTDDNGNLMAFPWDMIVPTRWQPPVLSPETVAEAERIEEQVHTEPEPETVEVQEPTPILDEKQVDD